VPQLTAVERRDFLETPGVLMRVAVVRADGSPLVTPIWFLHEDGCIFFTPRARSEWFACLRRAPRVALSIDEQPLPYRKLLVEAHAELVYDLGEDDAWRELYRRIARRYVPPEVADAYVEDTIDQPRALYRVVLAGARLRSWRMPLEGEPGDGIWHRRYYAPGSKLSAG
jgi:nitroimidazol reductase NimA-like FMN-containing flavoprotein (pyridoxamine 5'-phosphate oxidase superfamily)